MVDRGKLSKLKNNLKTYKAKIDKTKDITLDKNKDMASVAET